MARISTGKLAQFCRRVGTGLRAGVAAHQVLAQEASAGSSRKRDEMRRMTERLDGGGTIAEAMKQSNGFFPPMMCELVEVGEQTGRLDDVLLRLADHYDHSLSLKRQFMIGIAWPTIQLIGAILVVGLLISCMGILADQPIFGLKGLSGTCIFFSVMLFLAGSVGLVVVAGTRGWLGTLPIQIAMRIPILGGNLRTLALARLAWSLHLGLESGLDARRSISLALRSTQNPYFSKHVQHVDEVILSGREFHEALRSSGAFPEEFLENLAAAEVSGTHSEAMLRLANEYNQRAKTTAKILTLAASFMIWGLVAALIVGLVVYLAYELYYKHLYQALDDAQRGSFGPR